MFTVSKLTTKKQITLLNNDETTKPIAKALNAVIQNICSDEEKKRIDKIKTLRNSLNASSTVISFVDYGAGGSEHNLSEEEMSKGQLIQKPIGELCQTSSKSYKWDFLLFKLVREFHPSVCLELGTAFGISAAYQAAACELNQHGEVVTLEGSESLSSLARENFEKLDLKNVHVINGRFQDTLQTVLHDNTPINFVFIDGHHDEAATLNYFEQIIPHLSEGSILVFDDICWSRGMKRAWKKIQKNKSLKLSIDIFTIGIGVFTTLPTETTKHFKIVI
jgi:predicted O-methyltransferase YrrM